MNLNISDNTPTCLPGYLGFMLWHGKSDPRVHMLNSSHIIFRLGIAKISILGFLTRYWGKTAQKKKKQKQTCKRVQVLYKSENQIAECSAADLT